ncbi:MAG TPA: TerB N-terminal domain-containing protein [Micromonosporaceae bacterium]|nr:TerB N-terminal domain-containing protein [Micromonosporaceae bacterium]
MIAGHSIPGGMIYVGRHLRSMTGGVEPALINPELQVAAAGPPPTGRLPGPAPAYHLISPAARAAYLRWLAGGRRTDVPADLVLLFCYGLERRVVADLGDDPAADRDLSAIMAEARRLRARYGGAGLALREALDRLLDLLALLTAPPATRAGPPGAARAELPGESRAGLGGAGPDRGSASAPETSATEMSATEVRMALARLAATGTPVPADWALAWVRHHPALTRRAAQQRCPAEFDRLFALRYSARHGAGLVPSDHGSGIRIRYQPANPGLTAMLVCRADLPDVLGEPRCTRELVRLVDEVAAGLEPYSRWLARFPDGHGSLAAVALLPAELVDPDQGRLGALRKWAQKHLGDRATALIDAAELRQHWSVATPGRMARDEAVAFIEVLALLGIGIEPDVRFGAPALADGPAVLFHREAGAPDRPGARFTTAALVVRCAAAVALAAQPVNPRGPAGSRGFVDPRGAAVEAVLATVPDLAMALRVPPAEQPRLAARLHWLLAAGVDADRLPRQVTPLDPAGRQIAGRYLVRVAAAADPATTPATIAALARMYQMLGLDRDLVFRRVHEQSVGGRPRLAAPSEGDEPVTIRPADPATGGYALPWTAAESSVPLDQTMVSRKIAETATVGTLLAEVFTGDDPGEHLEDDPGDGPPAPQPPGDDGDGLIVGLDRAHSKLLRALAARPSWTRDEFAALADTHGVLPDGALDLLNEAAIETAGEPVVEGEATLIIDVDILRELLR